MADTLEASNLLDCPFCGKRPTFRRSVIEYEAGPDGPAGEYDEGFTVSCHECGFEIANEYRDELFETWNTRSNNGTERIS